MVTILKTRSEMLAMVVDRLATDRKVGRLARGSNLALPEGQLCYWLHLHWDGDVEFGFGPPAPVLEQTGVRFFVYVSPQALLDDDGVVERLSEELVDMVFRFGHAMRGR